MGQREELMTGASGIPRWDSAPRHTWNCERWVLDRFIEAVEAGDADEKIRCGQRWAEACWQHDWRGGVVVETGLFHPSTEPDPRWCSRETLAEEMEFAIDAKFSARRLTRIRTGAPLTAAEIRWWRRRRAENAFCEELAYEQGRGTFWWVLKMKHSRKRAVAHLGMLEAGYVAGYPTSMEVVSAIRALGYISLGDYEARSPNAREPRRSSP